MSGGMCSRTLWIYLTYLSHRGRERERADRKKMFKFRGWLNCPSHSRGPAGLFTAGLAVSRDPDGHSSLHSSWPGRATQSNLYSLACEVKQTKAVPCYPPRNTLAVLCSSCKCIPVASPLLYLAREAPTCFPYDDFSSQSLPGSVAAKKEADWGAYDQVKSLLIRIQSARRTSRISEI